MDDVKPAKEHKHTSKTEAKKVVEKEKVEKVKKAAPKAKAKKAEKTLETAKKAIENTKTGDSLRDEIRVVFKKALTDREQKVFDYFAAHRNKIVYAKDLATLLDLPRDYVYKYIKNLRAKIDGEALKNADKGGFVLNI